MFYRGTKVSLTDTTGHEEKNKEFILAEYHEEKYVFQLICLTGYDAGRLVGYVSVDPEAVGSNKKAVTREHLIKELKRNILFDETTLEIVTD